MSNHIVAIRLLQIALEDFLDSAAVSYRKALADGRIADWDTLLEGGDVHSAVSCLQRYYDGKQLPPPEGEFRPHGNWLSLGRIALQAKGMLPHQNGGDSDEKAMDRLWAEAERHIDSLICWLKWKADQVLMHNDSPVPRKDPKEYTVAKMWTTKDGILRISTKTEGQRDGEVEFAPSASGESTLQMRLMQHLCFIFPASATLREVMEQVYREEFATIGDSLAAQKDMLHRFRSLVSDVRIKKLQKAGLNPQILPQLNVEASTETGIQLRLAHLHRLDDKGLDEADKAPE